MLLFNLMCTYDFIFKTLWGLPSLKTILVKISGVYYRFVKSIPLVFVGIKIHLSSLYTIKNDNSSLIVLEQLIGSHSSNWKVRLKVFAVNYFFTFGLVFSFFLGLLSITFAAYNKWRAKSYVAICFVKFIIIWFLALLLLLKNYLKKQS
jgi:hypothetical protein